MSRKNHRVAYVFLFVGLLASSPVSAQDQALAWKFHVGDVYHITMQQNSKVETAVDRRVVIHKTDMSLSVRWTVDQVDDAGMASITQVIQGVNLTIQMPGADGQVTVTYDSASDETPRGDAKRVSDSYACLIDQPVLVSITPRGEITDVDIPAETLESIRNMPGSMEGRESLTLDSIRDMFRNATVTFPDRAMANGDAWKAERSFKILPQSFDQTTTFTYAGRDSNSNLDKIKFESQLELVPNPDTAHRASVAISEQSMDGTLLFDSDAGSCVRSESQSKIKTQAQYRDMQIETTVESQLKVVFEKQQD